MEDGTRSESAPLVGVIEKKRQKAKHPKLKLPGFKTSLCIKSRPGRWALLWNFSVLLAYRLFCDTNSALQVSHHSLGPIASGVFFSIVAVISPAAGLLTDLKFSRYKATLCSSYVIVVLLLVLPLLVLMGALLAATKLDLNKTQVTSPLLVSVYLYAGLLAATLEVFITNGFQFGMDQLHDSSTEDLIAYIHWYVWSFYACSAIGELTWNLIFYDTYYVNYIDTLRVSGLVLICLMLSIILLLLVTSICMIRHKKAQFHLEPPPSGASNPYTLLYRVMRFAWNHKVPLRRSAFTYCEDKLPPRLDLGKSKYGGPFTTRQVEDVKAFWGIVKMLVVVGPAFMLQTSSQAMLPVFTRHSNIYIDKTIKHQVHIEGVARHVMISNGLLSPLLVTLCIPLYLCFIYPRVLYHLPGILKRIGMAVVLTVISLLSLFLLDIGVHLTEEGANCMFGNLTRYNVSDASNFPLPLYLNPYFLTFQDVLFSLVNMTLDIAVLEFICSQSPHSMKGLLFGLFLSIRALFQAVAIASTLPFRLAWRVDSMSCGSGFYVVNVVAGVVELVLFTYVARKYKYRIMNEPSNEYRYAEEYYSNIQ